MSIENIDRCTSLFEPFQASRNRAGLTRQKVLPGAFPHPGRIFGGSSRECRHIHRHSRFRGNARAIGSKCVFASYRIPGSRFRGDDGNRRLETDILKLTTLPRRQEGPIRSIPHPVLPPWYRQRPRWSGLFRPRCGWRIRGRHLGPLCPLPGSGGRASWRLLPPKP